MSRKNLLTTSPPYAVGKALSRLGANLRTARLRRNLSLEEAAAKVGTGVRAVRDAENGLPGSSAAVYVALLWAYDLLGLFETVADPAQDEEGLARESVRKRARAQKGLSNDF